MFYEMQSAIFTAALAACWALEGMIPAVREMGAGATRVRHLVLGAMNAVPALGVAVALGFADDVTRMNEWSLLERLGGVAWAAAAVAFLALDLCQYASHVLMHKVPPLWRVHAVHHHAEHLESTTAFRFHTLEVVAQGLVLVPLVMVAGVRVHDIAVYNAILLPMSMFHHANVRLPERVERVLGLVVVTPGLHRMHHARWQPLTDSNYSAVLTVWDRLFGTLASSDKPESIPVGLDGFGPEHTTSVGGMLRTPFSSARAGRGMRPDGQVKLSARQNGARRVPAGSLLVGKRERTDACNDRPGARVQLVERKESP